jgi:hypothetical protein
MVLCKYISTSKSTIKYIVYNIMVHFFGWVGGGQENTASQDIALCYSLFFFVTIHNSVVHIVRAWTLNLTFIS